MARPTPRDVHIDSALTSVSIAYRNPLYIGDEILPRIRVTKQSDYYFVFSKGAWFRIPSFTRRAPGRRAVRVDYSLTTGSYACVEHAFAKGVADETRENADDPLSPETEAVEFVSDNLLRAHEKRISDLVFTGANWATTAAASTKWDVDTSDPIGDVNTMRESVQALIGREPNIMVLGYNVWADLKDHPDMLDRIKYTQRGMLTQELAASLFEVDKLLIGKALYDSALEGATAVMTQIWGKSVLMLYVPPAPALMTPAAGYAFEWKPMEVARFREDQERQDVFEVRHSVAEKITGSDAGYLLTSVVD